MKIWKFALWWASFVQSIWRFRWKSTEEYVSWHLRVVQILKKNWVFVPRMIWGIWWILMRTVASLKIFHFGVVILLIGYKVSAEKVQEHYISWHWKKIQILKKNWLLVWKMTWEIWWTFTWAVERLTISLWQAPFVEIWKFWAKKNTENRAYSRPLLVRLSHPF